MKKEITIEEATGKIVKTVLFSFVNSQMVINFTDDTFTCCEAERDCYSENISVGSGKFELLSFGDELLSNSGIVSQEELDIERENYEKLRIERHEKNDKEIYERLKARFKEHK